MAGKIYVNGTDMKILSFIADNPNTSLSQIKNSVITSPQYLSISIAKLIKYNAITRKKLAFGKKDGYQYSFTITRRGKEFLQIFTQ